MRQQKISCQNESGFTLIEVLIALAIFTIGILSANAMQIAAVKSNYVANDVSGMSTEVSDKIEKIMAMPYDHADLDPAGNTHSTSLAGYTLEWDVVQDAPVAGSKTVTINVSRRQKNVTLAFVKSDYEP